MKRLGLIAALFAAAGLAAADELEADWIAQDGAAATNGVPRESWRAEMLARREKRLAPVAAIAKKWVYCRHYVMGGSHYAYTEALSDAKGWHNYAAIGSSLCLAEYNPSGLWKETVLLRKAASATLMFRRTERASSTRSRRARRVTTSTSTR